MSRGTRTKTERLLVRLTPEEKNKLSEYAILANKSRSMIVRELLLSLPDISEEKKLPC